MEGADGNQCKLWFSRYKGDTTHIAGKQGWFRVWISVMEDLVWQLERPGLGMQELVRERREGKPDGLG